MDGMTVNTSNSSNRLNNVYSERTRIVRETNERAVKNKKEFAEGGIQDKRESRTECGVLVRNECICHVPCVAYGGKQKNVHGGTKAVRGENKRTYTGVQL